MVLEESNETYPGFPGRVRLLDTINNSVSSKDDSKETNNEKINKEKEKDFTVINI